MSEELSVELFKKSLPGAFSRLIDYGFNRKCEFEQSTATVATAMFCGVNLAFEFAFDVRQQQVSGKLISMKNGRPCNASQGGYSSGIYKHLVKKLGYRGSPMSCSSIIKNEESLRVSMSDWIKLLEVAGSKLLEDESNSLK